MHGLVTDTASNMEAMARHLYSMINAHSNTLNKMLYRYLTAPATSTAVERLFSAAGLILDAKRSKLDPAWVDHILFLREAFLLGTCKLEWE